MAIKGLKFFGKKNQPDLVGFDLNEEYLKIAHARVTGLKREVVDLLSHEVRGMSDDDISTFIQKTLADLKIIQPRTFVSVPLQTVITRCIEIPSRDPVEIREIVSLQASRHTPYSRSEIIIDTLILGMVRESYTKVLLVIAPRDLVVRQTKIVERAGVKVEKVFFPPEGIAQACAKILNVESSTAAIAIVHMDTAFTSFFVMQHNKILFVRGISIGADHLLQEKETYSDRFVDELQKSLESYVSDESGPAPEQLLLTGVVAEVNDLDDLFSQTLHMPIKHQTYFNHFSISDHARTIASSSKLISFFNLVAPLLLFDKMKLNLVSEEQKLRFQLEDRGKEAIKTGVFVMVFLALFFVSFASRAYFKSAYLSTLSARYKPVKENAKELKRLFTKTQVIKNYVSNRGNAVETLTELYEAMPNDVALSGIRYEDGQRFTVKGTSSAMASVFSFVTNLEKSEKFDNVKTKYVTSRNEGGKDKVDFEINATVDTQGAA